MSLVLKLALLTLCACAAVPTKPLQVVITKPIPGHTLPACYLLEPPAPPKDIELNIDDPNIIARTSVHFGLFNELLVWCRDMQNWADEVRRCFDQIGGAE